MSDKVLELTPQELLGVWRSRRDIEQAEIGQRSAQEVPPPTDGWDKAKFDSLAWMSEIADVFHDEAQKFIMFNKIIDIVKRELATQKKELLEKVQNKYEQLFPDEALLEKMTKEAPSNHRIWGTKEELEWFIALLTQEDDE